MCVVIGVDRSPRRSPAPPAARRCGAAAIEAARRLVRLPFDPHNRQNDDARRLGIGVDVTAAAERTMSFWKLYDDSHAPPPPEASRRSAAARGSVDPPIKSLHG